MSREPIATELESRNVSKLTASQWWEARRLRYNLGLLAAGALAFALYLVVLSLSHDRIPNAEMNLFTILFQGVGYFLFMAVANIFYLLGPFSERFMRVRDVGTHRRIAYALGFWFSFALPFVVPILLAYFSIFHPEAWQHETQAP